jgi:phage-related protein
MGFPKPIVWMGDSLRRVRRFSRPARQDAGYQLDRVQRGMSPLDWKPMPSVGPGVIEIRTRAENEYRVLYVARFSRAVYVLHAFVKKTRKTPAAHVDLARRRLCEVEAEEGSR